MPELDPLPVTPANTMAALNQRVMDMLTDKIKSQAAEVARWKDHYSFVIESNERHIKRIAVLEAVLGHMLEVTKFDDDPVFSPTVEYWAALYDARDALKKE
jgi:hypothetical protein